MPGILEVIFGTLEKIYFVPTGRRIIKHIFHLLGRPLSLTIVIQSMSSLLSSPLANTAIVLGAYVASIFVVGGSLATFLLVLALYAHFYLFGWHRKNNVRRGNHGHDLFPNELAQRLNDHGTTCRRWARAKWALPGQAKGQ